MENKKFYECPEYAIALLRDIDRVLKICFWNKNQKEMSSPFDNSGSTYETKNKKLKIRAYQWENDNDWNLVFDDYYVISWYKHLGRGTCCNKKLDECEWAFLYEKILEEIRKDFGKYAI